MNELFQKLIIPAKFMAEKTFNRKISASPELYAFAEKFAELIVKECAGVAEVSMPINSHPDDRLTVKNNVLKHFGVEE